MEWCNDIKGFGDDNNPYTMYTVGLNTIFWILVELDKWTRNWVWKHNYSYRQETIYHKVVPDQADPR